MSVNGGSQLEFRDRVILEICLCIKNFIEFRNCGSMYWKFIKKKKNEYLELLSLFGKQKYYN